MPTIDVRDTKLYYEKTGEGDPALVLIHGMCSASWSWKEQVDRLSRDFTCVAYDRRGHSRSELGTRDQSDRTHTDDLAVLIETLELDRPVLVGSSSGGVIAAEMMRSYPNLVRGAVLMEPALISLDPQVARQLESEMIPVLQDAHANGGERAAVDVFFQMVCGSYWKDLDDARREQTLANAHLLFPTLERGGGDMTLGDLSSIDLPTLVIGGSASPPFFHALNQILVDHLPNARHVQIEDSGHVVLFEQPDAFARATSAFVHEIAGVRSAAV